MNKIPQFMSGVYLTGHGGLDKLVFKEDIPVPIPKSGEVLIQVKGAGINNTDINTRLGWYSKKITSETNTVEIESDNGSWNGIPISFPRIQGGDICGNIIQVGEGVDSTRVGERILVRSMQNSPASKNSWAMQTIGSEFDGGFAQFCVAKSNESFPVNCDWSDIELASIPISYSTAEGMLCRADIQKEKILITGASGGVGSAAIQLAKLRGATIIAQCSPDKASALKELGADHTVNRYDDLIQVLGMNSVDAVVDLVGGKSWPHLLELLKSGGRYVVSGAIAGPIVDLDLRNLYLKDLTLYGSTVNDPYVFENVIRYIEEGQIKPLVSQSFPLQDIKKAQNVFMEKKFIGKLVLVP
jgi:NADPH:quinone reductase-like Zn-dependent oxidoreductase